MNNVIILAVPAMALFYDIIIGERPLFLHPVLLYGKVISFFDERIDHDNSKNYCRFCGLALIIVLGIISILPILLIKIISARIGNNTISLIMVILFSVYLLKTSFSMRHMVHEAREINRYVKTKDLDGARRKVSYIVSRDTDNLSFDEISSANLECVSESFVDGISSPLFYFSLFGLYGCQFYRAMNSADSRIGYLTGRYRHFGQIPARFDDVLNFLPARISVMIIFLSGAILRLDVKRGWKNYRKYANVTKSPNAGQTMSAYSGLLGVKLKKEGHYNIGEDFEYPGPDDVEKALKIYVLSTFISVFLVTIALMTTLMPIVMI